MEHLGKNLLSLVWQSMWAFSLDISDPFLAVLFYPFPKSLLLLLQKETPFSLSPFGLSFFKAFNSLQVLKNSQFFHRQVFISPRRQVLKEFIPGSAE